MVIGNLYPFEEAVFKGVQGQDLVEYIDIGGPSFLRAAAKSFERLTTVVDPEDYVGVLEGQFEGLEGRKNLAAKVFAHTASYDSLIAEKLLSKESHSPKQVSFGGHVVDALRYGENPQQKATWYRSVGKSNGLHKAQIIQGKPLSYNNLLDLDAAVQTLREFQETPACVSVKHLNPCGVATGTTVESAVKLSLKADPVSVFGGIIAMNRAVNKSAAEHLSQLFLECIVAPDFDAEALTILGAKKNLRLLKWEDLMQKQEESSLIRSIDGGFLVQTADEVDSWSEQWQVIGEEPDEETRRALTLAWRVCAHLKSNAIAIANTAYSLGLGMGQVNRVDAVEQAIIRMNKHHSSEENTVLASDAFFPFADSIERISQAGIRWVIQPGGSMRDDEVITACKELGVNMVLTGKRHFQH
ncbi:MAG: bifunctional phosphoribosylaminoimidazolecarboxamide formyltransferase/IMP cyclohydrolase PurH [Bdellovibrionaceae bacterium]|nr:bifunctional phosphoribosylaminoimidazolecarboxamide formyltransferase/IMP cyclohydrolase PurH [Pseudobdellovibrionaceae bacterium]